MKAAAAAEVKRVAVNKSVLRRMRKAQEKRDAYLPLAQRRHAVFYRERVAFWAGKLAAVAGAGEPGDAVIREVQIRATLDLRRFKLAEGKAKLEKRPLPDPVAWARRSGLRGRR